MKVMVDLLGLVCGAIVGIALGCCAAAGLGYWSQVTQPNDPTAGSVSIVVIITAPFGALCGAVLGLVAAIKRPRLFYVTILPVAVLLVAVVIMSMTLQSMHRPRNFVLEVTGTPGAEYVGLVSADGKLVKQKGTLPAKFEYTALRIEMAFALVEMNETNRICINASANNHALATGTESETGVHLILKAVGYSETFGGTSYPWSRMSEEEVKALIETDAVPSAVWVP